MEHAASTQRATPRRLLIGLTFLGFISLGLPDGLLGVAWPSIAGHLNVGIESLGALIAAFSTGYLVISVQSGRLLARLGVGVLLAVSCLATALALLGFAIAPAWLVLLPIGALLGAGGGAIDAGLNAYAASHYSPRAVTWLHACYGVGAAAGPALMTAMLATDRPWQLGYVIVGVGQLALALCFMLSRGLWVDGAPAPSGSDGQVGTPLLATLRRPVVLLSCLVFLVYTGTEVSVGQWSFTLLTLGRGLPEAVAGQWVTGYWVGLTVGRVLAGFIAGWVRPSALLWGGALGFMAGALLIWLGGASLLALAGMLIAGLSLAPIFPALIAITQETVGPEHTANAVGFQVSAATVGGATIPFILGRVAAGAGVDAIGPGIAVAAALYLALFAALSLRRA
jgi:fucose permease